MENKQELPWQQSAGALVFLLLSLMVVVIYGVAKAWPFAVAGNQVAVGILLEAFGFVAVFLAGLAAGFKTRRLITWGAPVWATAFYLSSLFLDDMVNGNTAGSRGVGGYGFDYGNVGTPVSINLGIRANF